MFPDHFQDLTDSSLIHNLLIPQISRKCTSNFSSYPANKQTGKQTNTQTRVKTVPRPRQAGAKIRHSYSRRKSGETTSDLLVTFVFVGATVAAGFHGDLARCTLPSVKTGARPASVEQPARAVRAAAIRTAICTDASRSTPSTPHAVQADRVITELLTSTKLLYVQLG